MTVFANILIFQPAAIGDAMLATPVAKTLKQNYPGSCITFWGHSSLRELLLGLCPYIDEYIDYDSGFITMLKTFWASRCDLFVDLSNSTKGMLMAACAPGNVRIVAYKKQSASAFDKKHAVQNFLETVNALCEEIPDPLFPTIYPEALAQEVLKTVLEKIVLKDEKNKLLVGIVPGVGKHRPHRAWMLDGWKYLLSYLLERQDCLPILIGGKDELDLAEKLDLENMSGCSNLIGRLSLSETAAILKECKVVISGDTGPAHLAVAVGTPVIGLYGATDPKRSGPYGFQELILDQSGKCECAGLKFCTFTNPGESGECMSRIMLPEVIEKLNQVVGPGKVLEDINNSQIADAW